MSVRKYSIAPLYMKGFIDIYLKKLHRIVFITNDILNPNSPWQIYVKHLSNMYNIAKTFIIKVDEFEKVRSIVRGKVSVDDVILVGGNRFHGRSSIFDASGLHQIFMLAAEKNATIEKTPRRNPHISNTGKSYSNTNFSTESSASSMTFLSIHSQESSQKRRTPPLEKHQSKSPTYDLISPYEIDNLFDVHAKKSDTTSTNLDISLLGEPIFPRTHTISKTLASESLEPFIELHHNNRIYQSTGHQMSPNIILPQDSTDSQKQKSPSHTSTQKSLSGYQCRASSSATISCQQPTNKTLSANGTQLHQILESQAKTPFSGLLRHPYSQQTLINMQHELLKNIHKHTSYTLVNRLSSPHSNITNKIANPGAEKTTSMGRHVGSYSNPSQRPQQYIRRVTHTMRNPNFRIHPILSHHSNIHGASGSQVNQNSTSLLIKNPLVMQSNLRFRLPQKHGRIMMFPQQNAAPYYINKLPQDDNKKIF